MIENSLTALIVGAFSAVQISLFVKARRKCSNALMALCQSGLMLLYIQGHTIPLRLLLGTSFLLIPCVVSHLLYEGKRYHRIYNITIQAIVSLCTYHFCHELAGSLPAVRTVLVLVINGIWCSIMYALKKQIFLYVPYPENKYRKAFGICLGIYVLVLLTAQYAFLLYQIPYWIVFPSLCMVIIILVLALILNIFVFSESQLRRAKHMMAIENNRLIMKQYVDDYVVFSDYMRRTEHDWRHFINALTEILNAGDIDRARLMLQSLSKANEANIMKEYCTDSLINAILNDTAKRSDTQGIDFSCTVRLGEEAVHIADIELTALMMNLLNNALENCDCPSCGSKKYINAELFTSSGYFIMRCENTIVSPPVMAGDRLITTKPDDGSPHGIGLESVRFIVNKHDGTMSIDVTDTVFKIRVMLKNKGP